MALVLLNSLTRKKEEFRPLQAPQVKMYVCGPTVYNFLHVGNFRGPVVFNLLRNWLEQKHGYQVTYALNFTDVDDRIIEKARSEKVEEKTISERYIEEYRKDFASLGLRPHEINPKVTDSIPQIIELVSRLIQNGKAYVAHGDVLYAIDSFSEYGKLSGRKPDELLAGARVEVDSKKRNPLDFALWKAAKPGEISWDSPWGPGRPGWHIECSAMVCHHLGEQIDIHGGGSDLIFPHHENEVAQSEGATGKLFSRYWLHVSMLNFSGQKMSKSLGNFVTMREFLERHHPEIYKWMILSVHYRSVCDFGPEALDRAIAGLARVYSALAVAESLLSLDSKLAVEAPADAGFTKSVSEFHDKVAASLDDDLNTPEAFAAMFDLVRIFNGQVKRGLKPNASVLAKCRDFQKALVGYGSLLSLFQEPATKFLLTLDDLLLEAKGLARQDIQKLVDERSAVRAAKDFAKSDEYRDQLLAMGIAVSDTPQGSHWEVAK